MDKQRLVDRRARVLKALAHPSRLLMLDALSGGEQCVCELRALIGADLSTVSKHLSVMRDAGILESEKRGPQVYYRLRVPCITRFFDCIDAVLGDDATCCSTGIAGVSDAADA
jgi:ArsR family transcriptional regulator